MTKKLLHKTTRSFLLLAVIILVISAPLFYFATHFLYIYETDEVLIFHKEDFVRKSKRNHFTEADIATWNKYNRNVDIIPDMGIRHDSIVDKDYLDSTSHEYEPLRELWSPIEVNGKKYTYTEQANLVVMEGMVISIAVMFLLVIAFLMTGIIWLSKRSAAKLWAPFYNTLAQIQNFELDKSNLPNFPHTDIEEFSRLNRSLEKLIEKNVAIYKSQREFVENAAHELQTPLALFQTKIDSLSQLEMTQEQSQLLASLNNDVARLNRLNKNLLLLSKIENDTYFEVEQIVLNEYLHKHFEFFAEQASSKNITIITDLTETIKVQSNPTLLDVLVNNLFLNAIRHNVEKGRIVITIANGSLSFANTGNKSGLDAERMFSRFAKINPSGKGNGLGLAIVRKVVEVNQWQIEYSYSNNLHFFDVKF
ncbi:sensor histidine kinase [Flavobacterium sp.]|uniref:sensor histidine kinase n=1 Tax=Flavobacterium sp. TaxID=239 RepID=UPI0039E5CE90